MGKSTNFFGQPVYGQLIKSLDCEKIVAMSRKNGGERYVKSFDGYTHLLTVFRKDGINHIARVITYVDIKKGKKPKPMSLFTDDFDMSPRTIVAIYRRRWQIESLFKQIKQNFPLRYFYGGKRKCNQDPDMGHPDS